jgi:hypothetical protein
MKINTVVKPLLTFVKTLRASSLIGYPGFSQTYFTMSGGGLE